MRGFFSLPQCALGALLLLVVPGCPRGASPLPTVVPSGPEEPVRVAVIDDPELAAAIERVWRAKSEAPLHVDRLASDPNGGVSRVVADVVIYPSGLLGELAEARLLSPLTENLLADPQLDQADVLDMLRLREVRWGEEVSAVTFGSPVLLLGYRADLLERLGAKPPETWDEYRRLAARLADAPPSNAEMPQSAAAWRPTIEPWGRGWAGQMLLARAAPYVRHRDLYSDLFDFTTMKPLIDGPPYVRALEEMAAMAELAAVRSGDASPLDAYDELAAGRVALAIGWATASPRTTRARTTEETPAGRETTPADATIRWTELPGSPEVYNSRGRKWEPRGAEEPHRIPLLATAGRLGSVTRSSNRPQAAMRVLASLSGEWSREVAPHSTATTLYRRSHATAPQDWYPPDAESAAAESYAVAAEQSLSRGVWMFSPRLPGRERYLAALDEAVKSVLDKQATPQQALTAAAQTWATITAELGEAKQRDAYQRSLGLSP